MMPEDQILDKLESMDGKLTSIQIDVGVLKERSSHQEDRIVILEKRSWAAIVGLVTGLTSLLAAGAAAFVNFFLPRS